MVETLKPIDNPSPQQIKMWESQAQFVIGELMQHQGLDLEEAMNECWRIMFQWCGDPDTAEHMLQAMRNFQTGVEILKHIKSDEVWATLNRARTILQRDPFDFELTLGYPDQDPLHVVDLAWHLHLLNCQTVNFREPSLVQQLFGKNCVVAEKSVDVPLVPIEI